MGRPCSSFVWNAALIQEENKVAKIDIIPDVGAPLAVTAVNIIGRTSMPDYHDWLVYGMTAVGYVGAFMGWGGDFVKQVGVSSLPITADKIYERVKGGTVSSRGVRRVATRTVSRYPAPAEQTNYQGVKLV